MIEALRVMTYIKLSLPTGNWDIAFFLGLFHKVSCRVVCSTREFRYDAKAGKCAALVVVKRRNLID